MVIAYLTRSLSKVGLLGITAGITTTGFSVFATTHSAARSFSVMAEAPSDPKKAGSIYEFSAVDIDGNDVSLDKYRGQVCIIVNVASKWGKTAVNYKQLVEFQNTYSETEGLRILAFPCNQFGSQEPGTNEEIKEFAAGYGANFDMFSKIDVNGGKTHPLYVYLKHKQGGTFGNFIKWNFTKFVIDQNGIPIARFGPTDDPKPKVEECIKKLFK